MQPFQFTPLREGRQFCVNFLFKLVYFNSRPSARGDSLFDLKAFRLPYFNSRPSARGDVWRTVVPKCRAIFQFTPLREGRRWSASRGVPHPTNFNSRPSARGDVQRLAKVAFGAVISIHAPPRGATQAQLHGSWFSISFQFTPLREGRLSKRGPIVEQFQFQFTPLREGRPPQFTQMKHALFQFTPLREGRPDCGYRTGVTGAISIHAPPRGATERLQGFPDGWTISIHAPPRGATLILKSCCLPILLFQFTPLREGRRWKAHSIKEGDLFQFTPLREGRRQYPPQWATCVRNFNSRPSARGDTTAMSQRNG